MSPDSNEPGLFVVRIMKFGSSISGILSLFDRNLNFRQPLAFVVLVPDAVDIALPNGTGNLISVFFNVFQNRLIGFR